MLFGVFDDRRGVVREGHRDVCGADRAATPPRPLFDVMVPEDDWLSRRPQRIRAPRPRG
jgi:hypothetical protein